MRTMRKEFTVITVLILGIAAIGMSFQMLFSTYFPDKPPTVSLVALSAATIIMLSALGLVVARRLL